MSLTLLSSNRVETLQQRLVEELVAKPLGSPFSAEVIVVPTFAMSRWLNLRIAQQQGIAANIHYPQAAQWIWQLSADLLDEVALEDPYARDKLCWRIFSQLPAMLSRPAFATLKVYLENDVDAVKRWQLSQRIAENFDRYQLYRPAQINEWTAKGGQHWQAQLWHELTRQIAQPHRAVSIARMIECLNREAEISGLPERVSLFALSSLAPVYVEAIQALSRHSEITLYQHSPSAHYWADLKNEKALSRMRLENASQAEYFDSGNELLASWGRQGQVMQDLLLSNSDSSRELDHSEAPGRASLLHCIQHSIFELDDARRSIGADESLRLHICHSPMRECQVLHDQLLALLDREPGLASEDILVMIPDVSLYAPYIESVFQRDESFGRPYLDWNISDVSVEDNHPLAKQFLSLLRLAESRFGFSEVMAFLDLAEIREQFGIDESMLEEIYRLLQLARVRWGLDSGHRQSLDLPDNIENTWQQAWQRLFAGYAIGDARIWRQIAPIDAIDSSGAASIAQIRHLIDRLDFWRRRLGKPASAGRWKIRLNQMIDEFFACPHREQDNLQSLRDAVDQIDADTSGELSPGLIAYWMERQLASSELPGRLFSGGITFCGMRPMRNIPFPVICLLGMDDQSFPRRQSRVDFDLMSDHWRPGDPRNADEDRYLMLETLLCARQLLYVSYCGRSLRDNSPRQPSVLVQELLDFVDSRFYPEGDQAQVLSQTICHVHPMQAFVPENFSAAAPGYDRYWYETARQLRQQRPQQATAWPTFALSPREGRSELVELADLSRFYRHPIQYFFNTRLGINLSDEQLPEDEEAFHISGLYKWQLSQRLADGILSGDPLDSALLLAEGLLPHGAAASGGLAAIRYDNRKLYEALMPFADYTAQSLSIDCRLDSGLRLLGEVDGYYPGVGAMRFTSSRLKSKDLLPSWLDHLALCACQLLRRDETSLLITASQKISFDWLGSTMANAILGDYVSIFRLGENCPLPIFPDSSYAWASAEDASTGLVEAGKCWKPGFKGSFPGECENAYIRLALHNGVAQPLIDPLFADYASRIFTPLQQYMRSL